MKRFAFKCQRDISVANLTLVNKNHFVIPKNLIHVQRERDCVCPGSGFELFEVSCLGLSYFTLSDESVLFHVTAALPRGLLFCDCCASLDRRGGYRPCSACLLFPDHSFENNRLSLAIKILQHKQASHTVSFSWPIY